MELTPLAPLQASAEFWDDIDETSVEYELKQLFIALFEHFLRTKFRRIDSYGYPHLLDNADFETIERFVKLDGLSLLNRETNNQPYMREVFRAWRGQHQRRGLWFLEFYLQMLWPNKYELKQYWHGVSNANLYPYYLEDIETSNRFLTSRVGVIFDPSELTDLNEISKIYPTLKRVLPARVVFNIVIDYGLSASFEMKLGAAFTPTVILTFEDSAVV